MTKFTVETDYSSVVVESRGSHIDALKLSDRVVLMKAEDGIQTHGGCALLIPFANRIRNASYSWMGRKYQLPKNSGSSSIHGFTRDMEWQATSTDNPLILTTEIDREDYPSVLRCQSMISLGEDFLDIELSFSNVGGIDVPLSVGLHPYFLYEGSWEIAEPSEVRMLKYVDSYFPDGTSNAVESSELASGVKKEFDNCFFVGPDLTLKTGTGIVRVETENMNYFVLYNGEYSREKSVAIEPMTSAPDAFNNGIGLIVLRSGSKFRCKSKFTFTPA